MHLQGPQFRFIVFAQTLGLLQLLFKLHQLGDIAHIGNYPEDFALPIENRGTGGQGHPPGQGSLHYGHRFPLF